VHACAQLSTPRCCGWRDCAFLPPSGPAAKARDAMQLRDPLDAALWSELPNASWKLADGVVLCDRRWPHFDESLRKSSLLRVDEVARLRAALSKAQ